MASEPFLAALPAVTVPLRRRAFKTLRRIKLGDVAVLDGRRPDQPMHPAYKSRGEAALQSAEQVKPAPKRYVGTLFLVSGGKRLADAWRLSLSEQDWASVAEPGRSLRLYDTETGDELRVEVVKVCLTRSPKRLEVQIDSSQGREARLLPVERVVAK